MLNESYQNNELPYTLRKALIALLYKKGDDTLLKNYRPISLTNYDYKILCFVLANRFQRVLGKIIHEDQTGYIKDRYIGTNARLLLDYFEHCDNKNIPGILLYLDFEKAFDSVEWNFMISVLEKFNFGAGFIKWVKILYNNPVCSIKNNGWLSSDINPSRGVRQGCPLSALLFVLTVEVMALKIRQNDKIEGFRCNDQNIKESLYADDTTLLLNSLDSLDHALETVKLFSEVAGPKLNVEKTEGILLGPLKDTLARYKGINFTNKAVRCLGIYMGHDKDECHTKNWLDKIEKIRIVFEKWKNRNLTLFGKLLIIKSLAISKLIHQMSILVTPNDILESIEKLIFKFLWESSERIKRKTLINKKEYGGIGMIDIFCKDKALKAGWIKRMAGNNIIKNLVEMYLKKSNIDISYLLKSSTTNVKLLQDYLNIPQFWAQVFAYVNECKTMVNTELLNSNDFLSEPLWLNKRLCTNKKAVFISNWTKSNILYVKDLFDNTGEMKSENDILTILVNKRNWIAEYSQIKKMLKPFIRQFDTSNAQYIYIKKNWTLLDNDKVHTLTLKKSNFYYCILIGKKSIKNYMENVWEREFEANLDWKNIYTNQIWKTVDKKLAEFNYKLLTNIICTRSLIAKWNKNINTQCQHCGERQTIKHLLFECRRVGVIWIHIGQILNLNIRYKHIVVGNKVENTFIKNRNLLISYIAYGIYKFWIMCENNKLNFTQSNLIDFIRKDLFGRSYYIKDKEFIRLCDMVVKNI